MMEQFLSIEFAKYASIIITLIFGLLLKELATSFVSGMLFYLDKNFKDGDTVYIDGQQAIIIKIGVRMTVFGISNNRGYTWRFVPNTQIKELRLEKIVVDSEVQSIPSMKRKIYDLENFLEKSNTNFKKRIDEREETEEKEKLNKIK